MARPISEIELTEVLHYTETIDGKAQTVAYWPIRKDADGVVLLRENVLDEQRQMNATNDATYINSLMDTWLNDETAGYLSYFDEKMRACIIPSSIKIKPYNSDVVTEIARRAYLLSASEITNGGVDGESILPMLKVHTGETDNSNAIRAAGSFGSYVNYWLRTGMTIEKFSFVTSIGAIGEQVASNRNYVRPVFKVANATLVSDKTEDTIYILPDASKPYRDLSFTAFLGSATNRPKRAKVQVSITGATAQTIQISNNAKDANPAWVTCEPDQVVELPNAEKTTDLWELGVKISAKGEGRVTCGEPVAIVGDQTGTGGGTSYVVGAPVSFTLTGWDPDAQGTTYKLKAEGYKIGARGVQLGLPSNSSTVNTQAVVAAALTIANTNVTEPDKEKNEAGFTEISISAVNAPSRELTVAIFGLEEAERVTVTEPAIGGVTVPVAGEKPVKAITEGKQITGTITWTPDLIDSKFGPQTVYTATITLTPKVGYKLDGVAANFFTVAGATSVSNAANSGVVTATFPQTGTAVVWDNDLWKVTTPETGKTPVLTFEDSNYTGNVVWEPSASTFAASTVYTATVTLTPKEGFTFDGIPENFFKRSGATSVTNAANSGVVTIVFPATKKAKS